MTATGSPGIRWISRNTTVTTTIITGTTASTRRARYAVTGSPSHVAEPALLVQPHPPEARPLGLVAEALHGLADSAQAEEVAVPGDRHLLVEQLRHLLPEGVALLLIRLPRELGL